MSGNPGTSTDYIPQGGAKKTTGTYDGDGVADRAITHSLGIVPHLVVITSNVGKGFFINGSQPFIHNRSGDYAVSSADAIDFHVGNAGSFSNSANIVGNSYTWYAIG